MSEKPSIAKQRSSRVAHTATIICCAIFISTIITMWRFRYLETLTPMDGMADFLCRTISLMLYCGTGFAAGYGIKSLWKQPYEE